ncbi:hypothetical protein QJS10_CPA09g01141 [Acorus calamus]|uniref:Uncharacterized protein n=1 Tax=Acorus calamus TaxID=4465 RepID=A0AAV9E559_ACOCL|nr:hypothetical protein QJS10_CPA09g01141 [Acorus calamus]
MHGGKWKTVKSHYGQRYLYGKQFIESLDEEKIVMIDLWEDIRPWTNSTNARLVKFTYMIPNSLPREYIVVNNDAKLLQIFKKNRRNKKFILYVIDNEDEVEPSSAASNSVAASELVSQIVVGDQRSTKSIVQAYSSVVNHDVNRSPFQPIEYNPHAMPIENTVSSDNDVDAEHEELQFDVDDLDVDDIFIHDEEQQSMSDDSVENKEDPEGLGDEVLKLEEWRSMIVDQILIRYVQMNSKANL